MGVSRQQQFLIHDLMLRLAGRRGKIEPWRQHYSWSALHAEEEKRAACGIHGSNRLGA